MGNNNDHNNNKYFYKVECPNSPDPYPKIQQQTFGSFQKELFKKKYKKPYAIDLFEQLSGQFISSVYKLGKISVTQQ